MADGTLRPIGQIAVGDGVCCHDGTIARVVRVDVHHHGGGVLASLDEGPYFVTTEHPFMGPEGWHALSPDTANLLHPGLDIRALRENTVLLRAARVDCMALAASAKEEALRVELAPFPVRTIRTRPAPADQTVLNLRLDKGHTYIAGGYAVHNKTSSH